VFVGIGPSDAVETYLEGVAVSEVSRVRADGTVVYRDVSGTATPAAPLEQAFWVTSASGDGAQTVTWDLEQGDWGVVVMNADASQGVTVEAIAAADTELLVWVAAGLIAVGLVIAVVATVMMLLRWRAPAPSPLHLLRLEDMARTQCGSRVSSTPD
jgi:hypothetical protein